jgi:hypothetical protein
MIWRRERGDFVVDERKIEFFCSCGDVCCPQEFSRLQFFLVVPCLLLKRVHEEKSNNDLEKKGS